MAYRLKEVLNAVKPSSIIDNTIKIYSDIAKSNKIDDTTMRTKKIIFEYNRTYEYDIISICKNQKDSLETWQTTNQSGVNRLARDTNVIGYSTNCSVVRYIIAGFTTYHIVFDFTNAKLQAYNAITQKLTAELIFTGLRDDKLLDGFCIGFSTRSNPGWVGVIPDIESFQYQPFVEYDIDLYNAVSVKNTEKPPFNNILSIL